LRAQRRRRRRNTTKKRKEKKRNEKKRGQWFRPRLEGTPHPCHAAGTRKTSTYLIEKETTTTHHSSVRKILEACQFFLQAIIVA
jgi:hypothetical protein